MTQTHVGKRRRREVREALGMRHQLRSTAVFLALVVLLVAAALGVCVWASLAGFFGSSPAVQFAPVLIALVAVFGAAFRMNGYLSLRTRYKRHCQQLNITESDMRALEQGKL